MALSRQDREDIQKAITEGMKNTCMCGLSPQAAQEMNHIMGMVKDVGEGDRAKGIEVLRDLLKWWRSVRRVGEKIGTGLIVAFFLAVGSGLIGLILLGVKVKLGKG